jgi:hypothetical protein
MRSITSAGALASVGNIAPMRVASRACPERAPAGSEGAGTIEDSGVAKS